MAVLWMTPIYSLSSWLSLVFAYAEPYLAVIREFYESYWYVCGLGKSGPALLV